MRQIVMGLLGCAMLTFTMGAIAQETQSGRSSDTDAVANPPLMARTVSAAAPWVAPVSPARDAEKTVAKERYSSMRWKIAWEASVAIHGAGSMFDALTSYHQGPYEANPLLRDPNGQFGNKAVMIKAGSFAGITAFQIYCVRKWPQSAKYFTPMNAVLGGMYFFIGRHNQQVVSAYSGH